MGVRRRLGVLGVRRGLAPMVSVGLRLAVGVGRLPGRPRRVRAAGALSVL
ncbi:hypothetical protein [Actinoplanes sp. ATCC 53533]|nr:hypothetical protein [Actinoplanes sp. ATCC 53533]